MQHRKTSLVTSPKESKHNFIGTSVDPILLRRTMEFDESVTVINVKTQKSEKKRDRGSENPEKSFKRLYNCITKFLRNKSRNDNRIIN